MKEFNLPYFLYVGNAYPHKNLERVIKVAAHSKFLFYIVTSRNIFTERLQETIKKLNAQNYVKLLGFVSDEELKELYQNSIGFIFPSISEGFGLPGLEAMKAGTILLASNIAVFKEIYGNHAIYFDALDLKSIDSAVKKALELTKVEAAKMIKENKEFVKRYSWEKMAKETLEVYNSVK